MGQRIDGGAQRREDGGEQAASLDAAEVDQPGVGRFPVPRPVLRFSAWDDGPPAPGAALGEHTDEVLGAVLGLDEHELSDLRGRGVIGGGRR